MGRRPRAPDQGRSVMRRALIVAAAAVAALEVGRSPLQDPRLLSRRRSSSSTRAACRGRRARRGLRAAGGRVVRENAKVGVATVGVAQPDFLRDVTRGAGAGRRCAQSAGRQCPQGPRSSRAGRSTSSARCARRQRRGARRREAWQVDGAGEPLADRQWDMTHDQCHRRGLVPIRARPQEGARRRARHRGRRQPSGHRGELQPGAEPELHGRHPGRRTGGRSRR